MLRIGINKLLAQTGPGTSIVSIFRRYPEGKGSRPPDALSHLGLGSLPGSR